MDLLGSILDDLPSADSKDSPNHPDVLLDNIYTAVAVANPRLLGPLLGWAGKYGVEISKANTSRVLHYFASNPNVDDTGDIVACLDMFRGLPGFDIDAIDGGGKTALMYWRWGEVTRWLLQNGANPPAVSDAGHKALVMMWTNGADKISLELMLEHGARLEDGPSLEDLKYDRQSSESIGEGMDEADYFLFSAWKRNILMAGNDKLGVEGNKTKPSM